MDLLLFFTRHPRTMLTSEQLAAFLGYELTQIKASLEVLLDAGFLTRTQNRAHAARLYVFTSGGSFGGWLPSLLRLAATREGRLQLLSQLSDVRQENRPESKTPTGHGRTVSGPVLVRGADSAHIGKG